MKIIIVGGSNDGARLEIPEDLPTLSILGETLSRHEILITNHDDRREAFVLYTPPDLSLADIFRKVLTGYRKP